MGELKSWANRWEDNKILNKYIMDHRALKFITQFPYSSRSLDSLNNIHNEKFPW